MNIKKRNFIIILIVAFFVGSGVTFVIGQIVSGLGVGTIRITQTDYKHLMYMNEKYSKLESLWNDIDENFYKDVDDDMLEDSIYRGLFAGLKDKYSTYMSKEEYETWMSSVTGEFEGVGITFSKNNKNQFVVLSVVKNSPASNAGIKSGDIILKVNDKTYTDADAIGSAMRGKAGTEVKITFSHNKTVKSESITRAKIVTESVNSKILSGNIGYVSITGFEEATGEDFKKALSNMELKNVKGIIIDLRDNGGGIVDSGVTVADELMKEGVITYLEDQNGKKKYYKSDENAITIPYVLLVNENTASTSEIVSAAIKDTKSGKIVGTTTFGKGVVQTTQQLDDESAYKLTIMQYFSPDGKQINGKGVKPDYIVKGKNAQLQKALSLLMQ